MANNINSILEMNTAKTPIGLKTTINQTPHLNFQGENAGGIHVYWNAPNGPGITINLGPIKLLSHSPQNAEIELEGTFTEMQNDWEEYKNDPDNIGITVEGVETSVFQVFQDFLIQRICHGGIWFTTENSPGGQFVGDNISAPLHTVWGNLLYMEIENHKEAFTELLRIFEEGTVQ